MGFNNILGHFCCFFENYMLLYFLRGEIAMKKNILIIILIIVLLAFIFIGLYYFDLYRTVEKV